MANSPESPDRDPQDPNRNPNNNQDGQGGPGGNEPNFNWRGVIMFAIAFGLIAAALVMRGNTGSREITYEKFNEILNEGGPQLVVDEEHPFYLRGNRGEESHRILTGYYVPEGKSRNNKKAYESFELPVDLSYDRDLRKRIEEAGYYPQSKAESQLWASLLFSFLPILILILIIWFIFRQQIKMAGKGALNFGKSKARMLNRDRNKVTFKDVAGVDEPKEEVQEIVEFLKDPKRFQRLGGRIPKGVLMVGPPGTGKTLLARAIAGEADVPFFSISGSDFVEMFVGVGASRVRDMFEQGKKAAPCLIFIDEIDAVGRHRGHGVGGGHDEREQTLNALLVEMDGFDTQEGVIIIAATNRPDVLDPALLRPGRFDRQISVPLPDIKGREQILRVHAKKIKLAEEVDLAVIARGTPGYSGAELANVVNEAALMAARRESKAVNMQDLEEARDKVKWGRERRSMAISEKEKENTAYHEAGHAILNLSLDNTEPLHKVTIIPRGPALGATMMLPVEDRLTYRRNELLDELVVVMGGRIAEELKFGDITNGAYGDIRMATSTARRMVCEWGMSDKIGMVGFGDSGEPIFLGRDMAQTRAYSEATAEMIDGEIKRFVDEAYAKARRILEEKRDSLEVVAKALLEYETLDGSQIQELIDTGTMANPPKIALPPEDDDEEDASAELADADRSRSEPEHPPIDDRGIAGAPA